MKFIFEIGTITDWKKLKIFLICNQLYKYYQSPFHSHLSPLLENYMDNHIITVLKKDLIELNVVAAFSQKLERTHGSSSNKLEFNCKKSNGFWFHKQLQFNFHVKLEWFKLEICLTPFVRCIFNFKVIIMIQKYHMIFWNIVGFRYLQRICNDKNDNLDSW